MKNYPTKVISFSLFGDDDRYTYGAIKNAELAQTTMPDFECWFYVDETVPKWCIKQLSSFNNTKIIKNTLPNNVPKTLSRFLAFEKADIIVVRDTDDRMSVRSAVAVQEWIDSGLSFHIIKDHPEGHSALILAGMWGGKGQELRNIKELILSYYETNREISRNSDQEFLANIIYPKILNNCLFHNEFYTPKILGHSKMIKFSTPNRYPSNYIGVALNKDDYFVYNNDSVANNHKKYEYDLDLLERE